MNKHTIPFKTVIAAAVLAALVIPVAASTATAHTHAPVAPRVKKQLRRLKARVAALEGRSTAPTGLAGGALTGSYPNPTLGTGVVSEGNLTPASVGTTELQDASVNADKLAPASVTAPKLGPSAVGTDALKDASVTSGKLAPAAVTKGNIALGAVGPDALTTGAVTSTAIAPGAVGRGELAPGGVTADRLADAFPVTGGRTTVNPGQTEEVSVNCPQGNRLLSGGFEWGSPNANGASVISSGPTFTGDPNIKWTVQGRVDTGGQANTIIAEALCIKG